MTSPIISANVKPNKADPITDDMIQCWRVNFGLKKREPADAARWWATHYKGAPAGAVAALGLVLNEIDRLRNALRYEENRFSRIGTHHPDCWKWGPGHYECALRYITQLESKK